MKLFLSSYKLGNNPQELLALYGENKRVGVVFNALDYSTDTERLQRSLMEQFMDLKQLGLEPEVLDLKEYFDKHLSMRAKLDELGGVWVMGGNTFVLRVAYAKCGLDRLLLDYKENRPDFVYGGYSAGGCVLQESLHGVDIVDPPEMVQTTYKTDIIWEGVGLLDYAFVPHYRSDHPEADATETEVDYYKAKNLPYKTLRDGEHIIVEV